MPGFKGMPSISHIAFARNSAGQLVAATDLLDNVPQTYSCVACGHALEVRRSAKSPAYFRHVTNACERGNLHATRAAALAILAEGRFVFAPALHCPSGGSSPRKGKCWRSLILLAVSIRALMLSINSASAAFPSLPDLTARND
jgi:hypothetical protein